MTTQKLYQVRIYKPREHYSCAVGFKGRLLGRSRALQVQRRLRKGGHDVIVSAVNVRVA